MSKTLYIFDFDDTLAKSDSSVRVIHKDGDITELSSEEFASYNPDSGDTYDFEDFEIYPINGQPIKNSFNQLSNAIQTVGLNNVAILTARSNPQPVIKFLSNHGINPSITVRAIGSNRPLDKGKYVGSRIKKDGYDHIHVYEDNIKNINAISDIAKKNNVDFSYTLVTTEDIDKLSSIKKYIRNVLVESMNNSKQNKQPGAGIIILKQINNEYCVLGLRIRGVYDLPKGQLDPGEGTLEAAIRETYEEAGIKHLNFKWGMIKIKVNHLTLYVAETTDDPFIIPNPTTGECEHESAHWLGWEDILKGIKPYMQPALIIAKNIVNDS